MNNNILCILSVIVMFHFASPAQAKPEDQPVDFCSTTDKTAKDARELLKLLEDTPSKTVNGGTFSAMVICEWANAVRDRDTKALEKLFDDDLIVTTHDGKTRTKKEELEEALKPEADIKTKSIRTEYVRIRRIESIAIITALTKMHFVVKGKDVYAAYRYTAVLLGMTTTGS